MLPMWGSDHEKERMEVCHLSLLHINKENAYVFKILLFIIASFQNQKEHVDI